MLILEIDPTKITDRQLEAFYKRAIRLWHSISLKDDIKEYRTACLLQKEVNRRNKIRIKDNPDITPDKLVMGVRIVSKF